jgi:hypothetical protein
MTLLTLALTLAAQADEKKPVWHSKYADAVALAAREGKPLVVDAGREA